MFGHKLRIGLASLGLAGALGSTAACVRPTRGFQIPSSWPRIGVAHGSIRVPDDMVLQSPLKVIDVCVDGICGRESTTADGEEEWRGTFLPGVLSVPPTFDRGVSRAQRAHPAPETEFVFGVGNEVTYMGGANEFAAFLALRGRDGFVVFDDHADLEKLREIEALRANMLGLATRWSGGPADCRPGHFVTGSNSFVDTPSLDDSLAIALDSSGEGDMTVLIEVRGDGPFHLRREFLGDRRRSASSRAFDYVLGLDGKSYRDWTGDKRRDARAGMRNESRAPRDRIIRFRGRRVGGLRGDEIVIDDQGDLQMGWASAGRRKDPSAPGVRISMFVSYERGRLPDALAEWDAMLETFRPLRGATHGPCSRLQREQ